MQPVARETQAAYERRLERALVPASPRPAYHQWTRFYLDFCHKYGHVPRSPTSLGPFLDPEGGLPRRVMAQRQQNLPLDLVLLC